MQTFKYLRLQGCVVSLLLSFYSLFVHFCVTTRFPADKISILSTYNGQKHLIRDVIAAQCAQHPLYGEPNKITTVDRFQGQQNDSKLLEHNSVFSGDTKGSAGRLSIAFRASKTIVNFLSITVFFWGYQGVSKGAGCKPAKSSWGHCIQQSSSGVVAFSSCVAILSIFFSFHDLAESFSFVRCSHPCVLSAYEDRRTRSGCSPSRCCNVSVATWPVS